MHEHETEPDNSAVSASVLEDRNEVKGPRKKKLMPFSGHKEYSKPTQKTRDIEYFYDDELA